MENFIKNTSLGVMVIAVICSIAYGLFSVLEYFDYSPAKILFVIILIITAYFIGLILMMILEN